MIVEFTALLALLSVAPEPASTNPPVQAETTVVTTDAAGLAFVQAFSPSDLRRESELRVLRTQFIPMLRKDPTTGAMLNAYPALGPALIQALESNIETYMAEYDARFYPRAIVIARRHLSDSHLKTLTQFYSSSLGKRSLRLASQHLDASEVGQAALDGKDVSPDMTTRQVMRAGIGAMTELTDDERRQVLALAMSPAGRQYRAMMPEMISLQTELSNTPGPRFSELTQKAMLAAFQRVTGIKPKPKT